LAPMLAPGRRRLFSESFGDLHRLEDGRLSCLPFEEASDLGLGTTEAAALQTQGRLGALLQARSGTLPAMPSATGGAVDRAERALRGWQEGCQAVERGEADLAGHLFARAETAIPGAPLLVMAEALAEIAQGRTAEAATTLGRLATDTEEPRRAVLEALLLARGGDWGAAESRLAGTAGAAPENPLISSSRYHLALWQGRFAEARTMAAAERLAATDRRQRALWGERAGDAAVLAHDLDAADQMYQQALAESDRPQALLCRLADVRFLRGDISGERDLRERVYGFLRSAPAVPPPPPAPRSAEQRP
jgi:hypothetical protein